MTPTTAPTLARVHIPPAEIMYSDWNILTQEKPPIEAFKAVPDVLEHQEEELERTTAGQLERTAAQRRKARYFERRNALQLAIEVKLIALGYGILTAVRTAALALQLDWQKARNDMERLGYDYLNMTWGKA